MDNKDNTIYLVNFENYLKPKVPSKQILQLSSRITTQLPQKKSAFDMFCESSSIHGFSMLILSKNTSKCEQVTWKVFILFSVLLSAGVFWKSVVINAGTPTVTTIESTHNPSYEIPFPAVTLCSLNRLPKDKSIKIAEKFSSTSTQSVSEILRLFEVPLYASEEIRATPAEFQGFDEILSLNNYSLGDLFDATLIDCMHDLVRCNWKGQTVPCNSIFEVVYTSKGRCCSFNFFASKGDNQPIKGFHSLDSRIPRHNSACGSESGLTVLIDPESDDYLAGFTKSPGYQVIIHDAFSFPEDNADNEFVSIKTETYMGIKSEYTYGTTYLRDMDLITRACVFNEEYILEHFQEYSLWNCVAECQSVRMLEKCKCIPHHMMRLEGQQLCNMSTFDCVNREYEIFQGLMETADVLGSNICGCMPECSFNEYRTMISSAPLNRTFAGEDQRLFNNITITNQILLHVFFVDLTIPTFRMDSIENWQSIVGVVGGITGITMGFSSIALSEAFFFICIRPIYIKCLGLVSRCKQSKRTI